MIWARRNVNRKRRGLTLPEVLIAAAVTAVALLGIAGMFPTGYQSVKYGGKVTQANALAQWMMEAIKNEAFGTVSSYNGVDTNNNPPGGTPNSVKDNWNSWKTAIVTGAGQGGALLGGRGTVAVSTAYSDLLQLTVTVQWSETTGTRNVRLVNYVLNAP